MEAVAAVVLAAGQGTRMRSEVPKVLHPLCGRPLVWHVVRALLAGGAGRIVVVVGPRSADGIRACLEEFGPGVDFALQPQPRGTGHATLCARASLRPVPDSVLVTYGDMPLLRPATFARLAESHRRGGAAATVLTARVDDPRGYGRVVRDPGGGLLRIVEEADATPEEAAIQEINTGTYCFSGQLLFAALEQVQPANAQGEYYLPDALAILRREGYRVGLVTLADPEEAQGINGRDELAAAARMLRMRLLHDLMEQGVSVIDPQTTYVGAEVTADSDAVVEPFTVLEGRTHLGARCRVGPYAHLVDTWVGEGAAVSGSRLEKARISPGARVRGAVLLGPGAFPAGGP